VPRLLLLPLLLLAGCSWSGDAFYASSEAQAPIAPGTYTTNESAHPAPNGMVRISVLPSGLTRFELPDTGRGDIQAGFVPLGTDGHFHILWVARLGGEDTPAGEIPYGLLELRPGGHYMVYLPDCSHDRADALAAGAAPGAEGGDPDCVFPNRASLEAGMRAYARHPYDGLELIPAT
jgi:hypothetical protein